MSSARGIRSEERQQRNSSPNAQTQGRKSSERAKLVETAGQRATSPSALQSPLSPSLTPSGIVVRPWRQQGGHNNSLPPSTQAQGNPNSQGSRNRVAESSSSSQSSGGVPLSPEESSNNLQVRSAARNASNNDLSPAESQDSYYLNSQTYQNISTNQAAQTSQITAGSRGDMSPQTTGSQLPLKFQVILHDIAENLKSSPFLPPSVQDQLNQKLDGLLHELTTSHHALRQNLSATKGDRDKYQTQLKEAYDQLAETIRDCKKITDERDALELRLRQLCLGPIKDDPHNGDSKKELQTINTELREQLRFKDEQLMGKRDLWMETHPDSTARRRRMRALPDPFNTPLQTATPRMGAGSGAGQDREFPSPDVKSPIRGPPSFMRLPPAQSGPSGSTSMRGLSESFASPIPSDRRGMRRHNIPAHSPTTRNDPNSPIDPASLRRFNSDPSEAMAMVPFGANQDRSLEFKIDIGRLYQLVQDWATTYANLPDFESDQAIAMSDHLLWEYMMNCTYPGQKEEAHARVMALLGDPATRVLFITRMAVTYCIQDIMSVETFKRFGFHATRSIDDVKIRLKEGGLATDARQVLIDKQVKVLQDMKASPRFNVFRHDQLTLHSKRLRDMLGPLLNTGCSRTQSCAAILAITTTAWELAFKMHTSHLSFKILFPETTAKFNSDSMIALGMTEDPYQLQCQQTRLNLVVTPVITLRDDRGTTIKVKNVCKADVLILT